MTRLNVKASTHAYDIVIDEGIRFNIKKYLKKTYSSILVVTDEHVAAHYLDDVLDSLKDSRTYSAIVPPGEKSKSIQAYYELQSKAIECGLDRESLIIALGGGVIGDLAGFVAATFMRGVDYIQVPTTILAHDSSVGGKVAINHETGKNLIGNFYAPQAVIYDIETLKSLSDQEVRSGYAELIKEALIDDEAFLRDLLSVSLKNKTADQLSNDLHKGIQVKAKIVESDERESGIRKFLNLGHTLAHAIEADLSYDGKITHGEAVAIGLLFALEMSEDYYSVNLPLDDVREWFKDNDYPLELDSFDVDRMIELMKRDKKAVQDNIQMVLLKEIGKPEAVQVEDEYVRKIAKSFVRKLVK